MRSLITWAVRNSPAMNTMVLALVVLGAISAYMLRRETFPEFELEIILCSVTYPGASPGEVEEGICQKIEEGVRSIDGMKKITSVAAEGIGYVVCELRNNADTQRVLDDVRSAVDRIPSFPEQAEDPVVQQVVLKSPAIRVTVISPAEATPGQLDPQAEWELRALVERIRDDLLQLGRISQITILGAKPYQLDVEVSENTLRKYGLSLQDISEAIRRENVELPAGAIRTSSAEVLVRGRNKGVTAEEVARLPVLSDVSGAVITVGELAAVRDGFQDVTMYSSVDGRPALTIEVQKTAEEDLLLITDQVREYLQTLALPPGYEAVAWGDQSTAVRERLDMLTSNGISGLILVFLLLALFLEFRLAFWVSAGIPISVLGACAVLFYRGDTLNMISMFAFVMVLGIVVDDAIVVGENVYRHRQMGKPPLRAAIDGTLEVSTSVISSVMTTVLCFIPLAYMSGVMGKFIAVMPPAIICTLLLSLAESLFVLPCHLAETRARPPRWNERLRGFVDRRLNFFIERLYLPVLRGALRYPSVMYGAAFASIIVCLGLVAGGFTPFIVFPDIDGEQIRFQVVFPDGTPAAKTAEAVARADDAIRAVEAEVRRELGQPDLKLLKLVHANVGSRTQNQDRVSGGSGSHVGEVMVELAPVPERALLSRLMPRPKAAAGTVAEAPLTAQDLLKRWRAQTGAVAGAEELTFDQAAMGPGGKPIEFKLLGADMATLDAAVEETKAHLRTYPGVYDLFDDSRPGKWELQMKVKPEAAALGVQLADLANTVRSHYYGDEAMRLQRGRHEVKLMVRYPPDERDSFANLDEIRVRTPRGEIPLPELASIAVEPSYSEINRVNQRRSITITANVDNNVANAHEITRNLKEGFLADLLLRNPDLAVRWEGQAEQTQESMHSLYVGFLAALLAMFVLLSMEFRSYGQPLLVVCIIPFGLVGAVLGHLTMGLPLTMFSLFGLVALEGVVVNDSIVLIDFINRHVREGTPLGQSLIEAGRQRFRPIMLTSITTIGGLMPLLLDRSMQAQVVVPMAVSLCFGLALTSVWCLLLVPVMYQSYSRMFPHKADEEVDLDSPWPPSGYHATFAPDGGAFSPVCDARASEAAGEIANSYETAADEPAAPDAANRPEDEDGRRRAAYAPPPRRPVAMGPQYAGIRPARESSSGSFAIRPPQEQDPGTRLDDNSEP